jgi:hypothetical protein
MKEEEKPQSRFCFSRLHVLYHYLSADSFSSIIISFWNAVYIAFYTELA